MLPVRGQMLSNLTNGTLCTLNHAWQENQRETVIILTWLFDNESGQVFSIDQSHVSTPCCHDLVLNLDDIIWLGYLACNSPILISDITADRQVSIIHLALPLRAVFQHSFISLEPGHGHLTSDLQPLTSVTWDFVFVAWICPPPEGSHRWNYTLALSDQKRST